MKSKFAFQIHSVRSELFIFLFAMKILYAYHVKSISLNYHPSMHFNTITFDLFYIYLNASFLLSNFVHFTFISLIFYLSFCFVFFYVNSFADLDYNDIMFPIDSTGSTYFPPVFKIKGILFQRSHILFFVIFICFHFINHNIVIKHVFLFFLFYYRLSMEMVELYYL